MLTRHLPTLKHLASFWITHSACGIQGIAMAAVKARPTGLSGNAFLDHRNPLWYSFLASHHRKEKLECPPPKFT